MNLQQQGKIDKGWGYEIVWANNDSYCGKLLIFPTAGAKTSLVMHKIKKKSWLVNAGKFKGIFIDMSTGETKDVIIEEGKTVDFGELSPHKLESLQHNSIILEVGTPDYVEDRYRLSPGDSQKHPLGHIPTHSS